MVSDGTPAASFVLQACSAASYFQSARAVLSLRPPETSGGASPCAPTQAVSAWRGSLRLSGELR